MADYGIDDGVMDAYSLYDAAKTFGLLGGGGAAAGVTAGLAPLGGAASTWTASQVPISLGGTMVPGGATGAALPSLSAAAPYAMAALPALMGMFGGVPSGKANYDRIEGARQDRIAQQIVSQTPVPEGMSYGEYIDSKKPPKSPWDNAIMGIPDTDDGREEMWALSQYYQNGDGKQKQENFYKNNPEWYTPEGDRIYKYQEDADAVNRLAPSGIVNTLTDNQINAMNARGLNVQRPVAQSGVLPPPQQPQGALGVTPDRAQWLQENAPKQMYNGQELYAPTAQYRNQWRMS